MVQKKFATILLVAVAAMTAPILAAPAAEGITLDLAARDPEIHERALAFDDTSLQARDAMDLNERSFDDMLEQREETTGIELEERDFEDELEERSFEDGVELEERGLEDAVELNARDPFAVFDTIKGWFKKKGEDDDLS